MLHPLCTMGKKQLKGLYNGPFTIALRVMDKGLFEFSTSKWVVWADCKYVEIPIRMQLYNRIMVRLRYVRNPFKVSYVHLI